MKINKLRNILVISLIMTGTIQVIPVMAAPSTGTVTTWQQSQGKSQGETTVNSNTGVSSGVTVSGMVLVRAKGVIATDDPNREQWAIAGDYSGRSFQRYTHTDGTPYTGLYKITAPNGHGFMWVVLDKNGFLYRDDSLPQFAWDGGKEYADFVAEPGPNKCPANGSYYLGQYMQKEDILATYIVLNDWANWEGAWYHSNDKGICYRNQWFQDTDGKWYYFGDDCKMVTNTTIGGYTIGADGVCE